MQTFLQPGETIEFTAPGGGVTVDVPLLIGGELVVPAVTAVAGARFNGRVVGVFQKMPKAAGNAWVEGQVLYWDTANGNFVTAQSATARRCAVATVAAAAGDVIGTLRLQNVGAPVNVL